MDFRAYAEQKRKEEHKDIITDICMNINNCADCHNDETHQTDCNLLRSVELHKVSANSFYMEPYGSKTNRLLLAIAERNGYRAGFIMENGEIAWIKFEKKFQWR